MRILAVSDIHANLDAVRRVRARERNTFDVVVVPGDIGGNEHTAEVLGLLSSFECPVLYVYGNADYELSYTERFGESCYHLHLRSMALGDFTFVGMSGCSANWGRNPIAEKVRAEINEKHRSIIAAYEEADTAVSVARAEIERAHEAKVKQLAATAKDRRRKEFRDRIGRLVNKRNRLLEKAAQPREEIVGSSAYTAYTEERWRCGAEIAKHNREALVDVIRGTGAAPGRTVVMTHEHMYRMHEDVQDVLLYVFGHKHKFANTISRGSRFVTIGALHQPVSVVPETDKEEGWHNVHNINDGNYAIVELRGGAVDVTCVRLDPSFAGWRRISDRYLGSTVPWA